MTDTVYLLSVILVMTVATFATRAFPFVALKGKGDHPTLDFLGRYMPPAVMTILVLYSLKSVNLTGPSCRNSGFLTPGVGIIEICRGRA